MHPFFRAERPLVFAHRGGSALAPENTLAAFSRGLALGADGLELDVHLSSDGEVVVHHDATLERTTDRRGAIADFTAEQLAGLDAGFHFAPERSHPFRGKGCGIPTLHSVLDRYPEARVIIEMKVDDEAMARAVVQVVRATASADRVCLGAFGQRALHAARALEPGIATSAARDEVRWALYRSWCRWPVRRAAYQAYQVPEVAGATRVVSERFVRDAHAAGLAVQVWTVDTVDDARRLLGWGVDALITDRPDLIVGVAAAGH